MSFDDILSCKLKRLEAGASPDSVFWEHKTLNLHRVILEHTPSKKPKKYAECSTYVRDVMAQKFRCSWWRGLGFGVIIYTDIPPEDIEVCVEDIDSRENPRGTWQWSIFVFSASRTAIGVHMWMNGYLSDIYLLTLKRLESEGYNIGSYKKEKDKLMKFLTQFHHFAEFTNESKST